MANKFGYVKLSCGCNAWSNNCTELGRTALQNSLQNKAITKANILSVFENTNFMEIGGQGAGKKPIRVEITKFFPENGVAQVKAYRGFYNGKYTNGATIEMSWDVPTESNAELLKKIDSLESRIAILEKLLAK